MATFAIDKHNPPMVIENYSTSKAIIEVSTYHPTELWVHCHAFFAMAEVAALYNALGQYLRAHTPCTCGGAAVGGGHSHWCEMGQFQNRLTP